MAISPSSKPCPKCRRKHRRISSGKVSRAERNVSSSSSFITLFYEDLVVTVRLDPEEAR